MKLYKLTDKDGYTRNKTLWGENITHEAAGDSNRPLCSNGWIHAYEDPRIAVLMNPCHGKFTNPILWEAEGEVGLRDGQLKCGCRKLTTLRKLSSLPFFTLTQKVAFGILCAKEVCSDKNWKLWADNWLNNSNRGAVRVVRVGAVGEEVAAEAAAWAVGEAEAAWAAAWEAAWAAARAVKAAAWEAAWAAARAAEAAAEAAARAAEAAAREEGALIKIDLIRIINKIEKDF